MKKTIFIFFAIISFIHSANAQQNEISQKEIQTSAEETYFQSPDFISIEVTTEQVATSAQEAISAIDKREIALNDLLKKINPNIKLNSRGNKISASTTNSNNLQIKAGQALAVKRSFLIECSELSTQSKIIDTILQAAQFNITEIRYFVRDNNQPLLDALNRATSNAKRKAEVIAKSLGLELGNLISADTNEEATGEMVKERMLSGEESFDYGDKKLQVVVTLKFSVR